jgi:hypothetical protein
MEMYLEIIFLQSFPVLLLSGFEQVLASEGTRNSLVRFARIAAVDEVQGFIP